MIYDQVFDLLMSKPQVASAAAAVGSVAVAIIALIFSIRSSAAQRKHNRLSVRPLASVPVGDYENQVFVKLTNNGTGPMIIKSIRIINAPDPSRPLIDATPPLQPGVYWTQHVRDVVGRSIRPGGELVLLGLASKSRDSKFVLSRDQVRQALGRLEVHVEYTDIYGSTLPLYTRSLKSFHRAKGDDLS
jgi:hypothetical protein